MQTEGGEAPLAGYPAWVPLGVDPSVPNAARIYDYFLDGFHNFAVDRAMAEEVLQIVPSVRNGSRANRAFLRRAVRFMVDSGIQQFLDIGSGIPTVGNVHEIAQQADPECRIVYVDKEPVAVAHSELILDGNDRTTVIRANLRDVEYILDHPKTTGLLDFERPIGLLMVSVLPFIPDSWNPVGILARYRKRLAPDSYLAISHIMSDSDVPGFDKAIQLYRNTPEPIYPRGRAEVLSFFAGFELVEPGLVGCGFWRPSGPGDTSATSIGSANPLGGVGHKR